MIEPRLLTLRNGDKLVLGKYAEASTILNVRVQFCKQLRRWVLCYIPQVCWDHARRLSKIEFLLETGRDLGGCTKEFITTMFD